MLICSIWISIILRLTIQGLDNKLMLGGYIVIALTITLAATAVATPVARLWIKNGILKLRILHVV